MIYLASPYTHFDKNIRQVRAVAAGLVCATLMARGETIFCPVTNGHFLVQVSTPLQQWTHEQWIQYNFPILDQCKKMVVAQLPGWHKSKGILEEISRAEASKVPIEHLQPDWLAQLLGEQIWTALTKAFFMTENAKGEQKAEPAPEPFDD